MITDEVLTGRTQAHLVPLYGHHQLQQPTVDAFLLMQKAAKDEGFDLQPASCFRSFERQLTIWNDKFYGNRPILDRDSKPIDIAPLNTEERCLAILQWSALPGASRHHWGSDLDIYDASCLPSGQSLKLEPWEYEEGGYFYAFNEWLSHHMDKFGFYRPFAAKTNGVAFEPWHISLRSLAQTAQSQLTPATLLAAWHNSEIAGKDWLIKNLSAIFSQFIDIKGDI